MDVNVQASIQVTEMSEKEEEAPQVTSEPQVISSEPASQYGNVAYIGTEVSELFNTKKSTTSGTSSLKQNENILTPDLVEGRVAHIRFQKQHAPGTV